jgi:hypothetical protein
MRLCRPRWKTILAAAAALVGLAAVQTDEAAAFGGDRDRPAGWGTVRDVHHWAYYPRYRHVYHVDPYAYRYSPRGYYPYYNSGYWVPSEVIRKRDHLHYHHWNVQAPRYKYYQSWGYPKHWHHQEWHQQNHGRHHRWHW